MIPPPLRRRTSAVGQTLAAQATSQRKGGMSHLNLTVTRRRAPPTLMPMRFWRRSKATLILKIQMMMISLLLYKMTQRMRMMMMMK